MIYGTRAPRRMDKKACECAQPVQDSVDMCVIEGRSRITQARMQGFPPGYGNCGLDLFCKIAPLLCGIALAVGTVTYLIHIAQTVLTSLPLVQTSSALESVSAPLELSATLPADVPLGDLPTDAKKTPDTTNANTVSTQIVHTAKSAKDVTHD